MIQKTKVLIVDDDRHIAELISLYLSKEGYETKEAYSGKKAVSEFFAFQPQLVILDLMLPEMDGYSVCSEIRKVSKVPIIMLTAKGETFDKVLGLELGADDYIVKPFEPKELTARVKAAVRRYGYEPEKEDGSLVFGNLEINAANYSVSYNKEALDLPPKEFELLSFLAKNKNQVFSREQLLEKIWGYKYLGDTRTVDVHIKRLREKLPEGNAWSIKTIWGVGYKFEAK